MDTNALIDRLESVLFVGMSDVVNRMQGNFGSDRDRYMKFLCPRCFSDSKIAVDKDPTAGAKND